jgi:hypothetical protein
MPFTIPESWTQPDGTYTATLERVEEIQTQFGTGRRWHWLVAVKEELLPMSDLTSANTGPQSESYKRLTVLLGRAPKSGEQIQDPTGIRCLLTIAKKENGFPKIIALAPYTEPQQILEGVPR